LTYSRSGKVVYIDFKTGKRRNLEIEEKRDEMVRLMRLLKVRILRLREP